MEQINNVLEKDYIEKIFENGFRAGIEFAIKYICDKEKSQSVIEAGRIYFLNKNKEEKWKEKKE